MEQIIKTLFVAFVYCLIWSLLEIILYGQAEDRMIDNIMMLLFVPIIYKAMEEQKGE